MAALRRVYRESQVLTRRATGPSARAQRRAWSRDHLPNETEDSAARLEQLALALHLPLILFPSIVAGREDPRHDRECDCHTGDAANEERIGDFLVDRSGKALLSLLRGGADASLVAVGLVTWVSGVGHVRQTVVEAVDEDALQRYVGTDHGIILMRGVGDEVGRVGRWEAARHCAKHLDEFGTTVQMVRTLHLGLAMSVTGTVVEETKSIMDVTTAETVDDCLLARLDVFAGIFGHRGGVADTIMPVIEASAGCVRDRAVRDQPGPRTRVTKPVSHVVVVRLCLLQERVALSGLTTHRVTCDDDLVEVGELSLVEEHVGKGVHHFISADHVGEVRAAAVAARLPLSTVEVEFVALHGTSGLVVVIHPCWTNDEHLVGGDTRAGVGDDH